MQELNIILASFHMYELPLPRTTCPSDEGFCHTGSLLQLNKKQVEWLNAEKSLDPELLEVLRGDIRK